MRLEELDLDTWASEFPSSGYEVFHTPDALGVLDDHTDAEMRLYGAYKGDHVVGLVPVFVRENPLGNAALSPPPGMGVPRLGPLVMPMSPKQRKRESVNRRFADLLVEELDAHSQRTLLRMECPRSYADPRPFRWAGLEVDQSFTYVLDVGSASLEDVRGDFSRDLRKEIRSAEDLDVVVEREGIDGAMRIYEDVADRYEEQGETFPLTRAYVRDLVTELDERARIYVARNADGAYQSGIIVLYADDAASFWQGGVRTEYEGVSVNSLVHWRVIEDVVEDPPVDSIRGYDLVGANTPRLCRYKSKFGADLVPYYAVESNGVPMSVAKKAYSLVAR